MSFEIEAKLKVDCHEPILRRLEEVGAKCLGSRRHFDHYFVRDDNYDDRPLRIRKLVSDAGDKVVVTYKGPKEKSIYKRREEIEFTVGDFEQAKKLLEAIGYKQVLMFEKSRQLWELYGCEVALDELPLLGKFVEIEGEDEGVIQKVQNDIGLGGLEHVEKGYHSLMRKEISKAGLKDRTFLLER